MYVDHFTAAWQEWEGEAVTGRERSHEWRSGRQVEWQRRLDVTAARVRRPAARLALIITTDTTSPPNTARCRPLSTDSRLTLSPSPKTDSKQHTGSRWTTKSIPHTDTTRGFLKHFVIFLYRPDSAIYGARNIFFSGSYLDTCPPKMLSYFYNDE